MTQAEVAPDTIVTRAEQVVSERLAGGTVLLDPLGDSYVRLNATAGLLWDALAEPSNAASLASALAAGYGIDESRAEADVAAFLTEMQAKGLVRLQPATLSDR